jgi:propanediol dehydratase small subunit
MSSPKLTLADYPLAENRADAVASARGKPLADITLDGVLSGDITLEDLRITKSALQQQAEIARLANRPTLATNFERAAELVVVPQDVIMRVYELLRPGRAKSRAEIEAAADMLDKDHGAARMATFVREAADIYEKRGLFSKRY